MFIIAERKLWKESYPNGPTAYLQEEVGCWWEAGEEEVSFVCDHRLFYHEGVFGNQLHRCVINLKYFRILGVSTF